VLEVTLFQGLFELNRLDRGKRTTYRPKSDLAKTFPPAPGKKITAIFEETEGPRKGNLRTRARSPQGPRYARARIL
jgi:hypothetical protein